MGTFGVLSLIWGIATLFAVSTPWEASLGRYVFGLLQGAVFIQTAVWTRSAGQEFERVATTTGADVEHLMAALEQLRRTYGLVLATIVLALALAALVLVLSLILSSLPTP